jgi:putative exporter of polyketide antibiotics
VPEVLALGIGVFIYGLVPRLTSVISYGIVGWSFLMLTLSSGLNLNHWLVDTSILHHINFAPAVAADWKANSIMLIISVALMLAGLILFTERDLAGD